MTAKGYKLEHYDSIPKEYEEILLRGISEGAFKAKGLQPIKPFSIFIKGNAEKVLGGISGVYFYGALYVDSLWLDESIRFKGVGTQLMLETEKIAKNHQASFITLNTMDWEALPFYQKLGYQIEFIREGYEKNSKMYILRKNISF